MMQPSSHPFVAAPTQEAAPSLASSRVSATASAEEIPASAGDFRLQAGFAGALARWWRSRTQPARHLHLVETLALGPRRSIALIELDGHRFLAGMGADGVSTLVPVPATTGAGLGAGA